MILKTKSKKDLKLLNLVMKLNTPIHVYEGKDYIKFKTFLIWGTAL